MDGSNYCVNMETRISCCEILIVFNCLMSEGACLGRSLVHTVLLHNTSLNSVFWYLPFNTFSVKAWYMLYGQSTSQNFLIG